MKFNTKKLKNCILCAFAAILLTGFCPYIAKAATESTVNTNRNSDTISYSVRGLDETANQSLAIQIKNKSTQKSVYQNTTTLTSDMISDGTYEGTISHDKFSTYDYATYVISISVNGTVLKTADVDFSLHSQKIDFSVGGATNTTSRTIYVNSTEASGNVFVPGLNNSLSFYAWPAGKSESSAKKIGLTVKTQGKSFTCPANILTAGKAYGKWNVKMVLSNSHFTNKTLAKTSYSVAPKVKSFKIKKTSALEKKKAFQVNITLKEKENPYGSKSVTFKFYNSKNKKVYTVKAKEKSGLFYADVKLKSLSYKLGTYSVKAVMTDNSNTKITLSKVLKAEISAKPGTLTIKKNANATTTFKITNAYIPGKIKKIQFVVYDMNGKKKKLKTYTATYSKKKYSAVANNSKTGKYSVYVYGYTTWNKKIRLTKKNYTLSKKNMGKQGWHYEKYAGSTYKFYYKNNEKVTDLTKILKLKKGSGKYRIVLNRAACVVTIYMYDTKTNKYDIPVKTCTVCVGRDVRTVASAGSLNLQSSFTPIGNYSICSNGQAVRYSLKPMHEPDGSTVYSRWCTHIVGNVYFHSIAVNSNTHYGLSARKFNLLGSPASAGCVRMAVADAKWIYDYIPTSTPVTIQKGSTSKPGPLGKIKLPKSISVNYDPTDPSVPDSRKKKDYKAKRITGYLTKSGKRVGY